MAAQMQQLEPRVMRFIGAGMIVAGLVLLKVVH